MVVSLDEGDNATRGSNNNSDIVLIHYTPSRPPPLPEPPTFVIGFDYCMISINTGTCIGDIERNIKDSY